MPAPRKARLAEALRAELVEIIRREMRDPRFTTGLLSITRVDVSADLKYATVYVSLLGDEKMKLEAVKALRGAAGLLRSELGRTKAFKSVPELQFRYDESLMLGVQLAQLIDSATREDAAMHAANPQEPEGDAPEMIETPGT